MITFQQGNLLEANVEALVNTVNTVGIMGKGIALMFKEAFPENFKAYAEACKKGEIRVGELFATRGMELGGPDWIINFPTKQHWRNPTKIEWVSDGLDELAEFIERKQVRSVAIPPLGCGNGGLAWDRVKPLIEEKLGALVDVRVVVYEPTTKYQNVAKRKGVEQLTPARALIAELIRRYSVLTIECTLLEVHKLAYFLEKELKDQGYGDDLKLAFTANRYGPYSDKLRHLLDALDGSYLRCDKRLADATSTDSIFFREDKREKVNLYLKTEAKDLVPALDRTNALIDGFQTPLGLELLATVDWILENDQQAEPTVQGIKSAIDRWPAGEQAANRKRRLFTDRLLELALKRLARG